MIQKGKANGPPSDVLVGAPRAVVGVPSALSRYPYSI